MVVSQLRGALSAGVVYADPELSPPRKGKSKDPWPELPPHEALDSGVPLAVVLRQGIRTALHRSLAHGFYLPVRTALAANGPVPEPVPRTLHDEVRLTRDGVRYRDGWQPLPT